MKRHFVLAVLAGLSLASSALAMDLAANADKAAAILNESGTDAGAAKIGDPASGLVDLKAGHGMHVWAMSAAGKILFDWSGQTKPGDDINDFLVGDGQSIVKLIVDAVAAGNGKASIALGADVPNPSTNELKPSQLECQALKDSNIVCAMGWP